MPIDAVLTVTSSGRLQLGAFLFVSVSVTGTIDPLRGLIAPSIFDPGEVRPQKLLSSLSSVAATSCGVSPIVPPPAGVTVREGGSNFIGSPVGMLALGVIV